MADLYQELQEQVDRLRTLVREGIEIVAVERASLAESITRPSTGDLDPDEHLTLDALRTMDLWIARAKAEGV